MRIVAGRHRGLRLTPVGKGDPGAHLRPTADRVRGALFSMLTAGRWGDGVTGAHVLDLFAGTGAMGLEALSRGAASVTFVENGRPALALLRQNLERLGQPDAARVLRQDATRLPARDGAQAGLVFLDPPYGKGLGERALAAARRGGWIASGALVVWEEANPQNSPDGFTPALVKRYGDTHVTVLEAE